MKAYLIGRIGFLRGWWGCGKSRNSVYSSATSSWVFRDISLARRGSRGHTSRAKRGRASSKESRRCVSRRFGFVLISAIVVTRIIIMIIINARDKLGLGLGLDAPESVFGYLRGLDAPESGLPCRVQP